MAVITLTSATGSPGVTTTALGLALHWTRDVVLADCDRDPAQSLQAGWLQGVDLAGRGLASLAGAHREHRSLAEELWLQTVPLVPAATVPAATVSAVTLPDRSAGTPAGQGAGDAASGTAQRNFLPGFTHPGAVRLFQPVWQEFLDVCRGLDATGTDVLLDAGRIGCDGLPPAMVAASDLVLVCVQSSLRGLAGLQLHLPTIQAQVESPGMSAAIEIVLVGPGRPYGAGEVSRQFGIPVVHSIAWDPRQAAVLSDGEQLGVLARSRGLGALARSYRAVGSRLAQTVRRRSDIVAGTRSSGDWSA
ncbi:hypothetical protein ACTQ49_10130 [Luteococcus sp. Sow4_B9]|uniref:hypothetical protein n=1 Tax=Luteococcus sp. Sow4_B9 TaxID=3438792 RepID=UPI003F947E40